MSWERPYLSIVVAARNDDHGGNLLRRMQIFVNGLIEQCRRFSVPSELIIVEWNPLPGKAPLAEALNWPPENTHCHVRLIEAPPKLHQRYAHWRSLPLYQMIAKNVGIRRAQGEFVLATNIDILFSSELFQFLSERKLRADRMYRVDRHDTQPEVPLEAPVEEQLRWAGGHLLRVNAREGTFPLTPGGLRTAAGADIVPPDSGIHLERGWFSPEYFGTQLLRWVENDAEIVLERSSSDDRRELVMEVEPGPGTNYSAFPVHIIDGDGKPVYYRMVKGHEELCFDPRFEGRSRVRLRLHVTGGGSRAKYDGRILNMRVLRIHWKGQEVRAAEGPPPGLRSRVGRFVPDLVRRLAARCFRAANWQIRSYLRVTTEPAPPPDADALEPVRHWLGRGWSGPVFLGGRRARWARTGAEIVLAPPPDECGTLRIELGPGPGSGFRPVTVEVRDEWGRPLSRFRTGSLSVVRAPLGVRAEHPRVLTLHATVEGGLPEGWSGDADRLLVVHQISWESEDLKRVHLEDFAPAVLADGSECWIPGQNAVSWPQAGSRLLSMIVRAPADGRRRLRIEMEGDLDEAAISDGEGTLAGRYEAQEGAVTLRRGMEPGSLHPIVIRCPEGKAFRILALRWLDGGDAVSVPAAPSPQEVEPIPLWMEGSDAPVFLHTNACGDFTLLSKEAWFDLRGYPEFDAYSMNIDSVLCWAAHHAGYREEILRDPIRIYHIEHAIGSGWTPEGSAKLYQRIKEKGIPWIEYEDVLRWSRDMNRFGLPVLFNHENWGLRDERLQETVIPAGEAKPK